MEAFGQEAQKENIDRLKKEGILRGGKSYQEFMNSQLIHPKEEHKYYESDQR